MESESTKRKVEGKQIIDSMESKGEPH